MDFSAYKKDPSIEMPAMSAGGGGVRKPKVQSGATKFTIEYAYITQSGKSQARALTLHLASAEFSTLVLTIWFSNSQNQPFYFNKQENQNTYLPGFVTVDTLLNTVADMNLSDLVPEDKVIMLYDYDLRKDVPTQKPVIMELVGKDVILGIRRKFVDAYNSTPAEPKFKIEYEIQSIYDAETGLTLVEADAGEEEPGNLNMFRDRFTGEAGDIDKREQSKHLDVNATQKSPNATAKGANSTNEELPSDGSTPAARTNRFKRNA